jgi:2-C-methyl-D-erythritol 4-phosphate cytidylyltransferase
VRINVVNPERTGTPMRTKAFGQEPADSLLESEVVARASLRTLLSNLTGHVIDIRRADPFTSHELTAQMADDMHQTEPHDGMPEGAEVTRGN